MHRGVYTQRDLEAEGLKVGALQNGILLFDSKTEWYVLEHRKSNEFTKANLLLRNDCRITVEHFSCLFSLHYKFLHVNKKNTTTVYEHIKKKSHTVLL